MTDLFDFTTHVNAPPGEKNNSKYFTDAAHMNKVQAAAKWLYDELTAFQARIDPGESGDEGQIISVGPAGIIWMRQPYFDVTHSRFAGGVKPGLAARADTTANDTAAQAAIDLAIAKGGGIVEFPAVPDPDDPGDSLPYWLGGLTIAGENVTIRGSGKTATRINTESDDLFTLTSAHRCRFQDIHLQSIGGGGHVFAITDSLSHGEWYNIHAQQDNDDKAVLYGDDGGTGALNYIDNLWTHCTTQHTESATIATFHLRGGAINRNRWVDMRPTFSGEFTWLIETTAASSYANDNTIMGITGEVQTGGVAKILGGQGTHIIDYAIYDLINDSTNDMFVLGDSAAGPLPTRNTTFTNVRRNGFSLGSGLYDLVIDSSLGSSETLLVNCGGVTPFTVDAKGKRARVIGARVTADNGDLVTFERANSAGSRYPDPVAFGSPITLENSSAPSTPDTDNGALYVEGGVLKYIDDTGATYTVDLTVEP